MPTRGDGGFPVPTQAERPHGGLSSTTMTPLPVLSALGIAAFAVAALYLGRELLAPMVFAVLLAFVLAPVVRGLQRLYLGRVGSVFIAVALALALMLGIGFAVSHQAAQLAPNLPAYRAAILVQLDRLRLGPTLESILDLAEGPSGIGSVAMTAGRPGDADGLAAAAARPAAARPLDSRSAAGGGRTEPSPLALLRRVAELLLAPVAVVGLVVVFVVLILLYREDLRDRLIRLAGARDLHRTMTVMNDTAWRLSRYFLAQVVMNTGYGVVIAGALWLLGLPSALLWGILAGLMRFVPFIGTPVAVVPPVLLALAVYPDASPAVAVLSLFLIGSMLMGQVLEPLAYGHSTGLSPPAIILATSFWAFLWGPVGLLLSTPLTVCLVVLGRHVDGLRFLDIMFGDRSPLRPEEVFYRAALAGDEAALVRQARRHLDRDGATLAAWCDEVVLRGLAIAQADWSREVLQAEQADDIRRHVEAVLSGLDPAAGDRAGPAPAPDGWQDDGVVLCIAGQGPFDRLAAAAAALVLRSHGYGARAEPNSLLETAGLDRLDARRTRFGLLSVLPGGSSASSVRYLMRRLQRALPEARTAIALWHADPDDALLQALRSEGGAGTIVGSTGEALALCQSAARAPVLAASPG